MNMKGIPYFALVTAAAFAADYGERMTIAAVQVQPAAAVITLDKPGATATDAAAGEKAFSAAMARDIRGQLSRRMRLPEEDFEVELESLRLEPAIPAGRIASVQVLGLGVTGATRLEGLFRLPVAVQFRDGGTLREQEINVSGILKITAPVYVAQKPLPGGHIITKEDLNAVRMPWRTLPTQSLARGAHEMVGARVKSFISSGQPVQSTLLDEPFDVKSGEAVELTVLSGPGVIIRSRGVARQEGRVGDTIRIEQPDTKKVLPGVVVGSKSVEVRL